MNTIRLISRNSRLAVIQSQEVISGISGVEFLTKFVSSYGDKNKHISLVDNKLLDFFTKELDEALLNGDADIAIHSAKDLPFPLPQGLEIIALTAGLSKADALVSKNKLKLLELPSGSKIGTSSQQRKFQIAKLRPDLQLIDVRGNIDERLALVDTGKIDALVVAECALQRLSYEHLITEILPFETHPLQGNLAVVAKKGNSRLKSIFYPLDIRRNFGKVSLASYILGHPELLTLKTISELQVAETIFYDSHLDKSFVQTFLSKLDDLGHSPKTAEAIGENLYQAAKSGKRIVCLVGADENSSVKAKDIEDYLLSRLIYVEDLPGLIPNALLQYKSLASGKPSGKNKILVTDSNTVEYEHLGDVIYAPFTEYRALELTSEYKKIFSQVSEYQFVVFQNQASVSFFVKALLESKNDLRWLSLSRIIAAGEKVASELLRYGLKADIIIPGDITGSIVDLFIERQLLGKNILLPAARLSGGPAPVLLRRMGYKVDVVELFEQVTLENVHSIDLNEIDIVAFASPAGVQQFKLLYNKLPGHISIITDGDDTRRSLYNTGLVSYEPEWVI